jgi:hypothetical protein
MSMMQIEQEAECWVANNNDQSETEFTSSEKDGNNHKNGGGERDSTGPT